MTLSTTEVTEDTEDESYFSKGVSLRLLRVHRG
jgi:hypothetical protein